MVPRDRQVILAFVVALGPATAHANPWDLYGFNPRALAMASSHTAFADDFTAVYYNPAALTMATSAQFGLGFVGSRPQLELSFDKRDRSIPDFAPPKSDGITFGTLFPLGGRAVANRIAVGLAFSVPTRSLLNGQALDPAIPHWYMYQSLPSRLVFVFGAGVMPFEWLSLGMGVQLLAGVSGSLDYELDVVAGRFSKKTVVFDIEPEAAPLLGLELRPFPGLRIGVTYRNEIESRIGLPVDLQLTGVARLIVLTSFAVQYTPHQVAVGASYELAELGLRASLDVTYALWSRAPDPSVSSFLDAGGEIFEGTGLGDVLDAPAPGQERAVTLAFRDIVIPRAGVEKDLGDFSIRAGYSVRPSPAPLQTSGTNYVDATAHQLAIGAGVRFRDPFDAFTNPLLFDVGGALYFVPRRRYEKVDGQDPVGPYDASGVIWVFGVALRYEFKEASVAEPPPVVEAAPVPAAAPVAPAPPVPEAPARVEPVEEELPEGDATP